MTFDEFWSEVTPGEWRTVYYGADTGGGYNEIGQLSGVVSTPSTEFEGYISIEIDPREGPWLVLLCAVTTVV